LFSLCSMMTAGIMSKIVTLAASICTLSSRIDAQLTDAPTNTPTSFMDSFGILGDIESSVLGGNIFDGTLQITHKIGLNIDVDAGGSVDMELYKYGCENEPLSMSGLLVSIDPYEFSQENFTYNVTIDDTLLGDQDNIFVNYTSPLSAGDIIFCTRVSTYTQDFHVAYYDFNFNIPFDLSENEISFAGANIVANEPDDVGTVIEDGFGVASCQCDKQFNCFVDPPEVSADEQALDFCIWPTSSTSLISDMVRISNFNAILSKDDVSFEPVTFGDDGVYNVNQLATVSVDNDRILVSTIVPEAFFEEKTVEVMEVSGTAFLELTDMRTDDFLPFKLSVGLAFVDGDNGIGMGCLASMVKAMKSFFR
jgi:hypothetical protein